MERKNLSKSCPWGHVNSYVGTWEGLVQPFNLRNCEHYLNGRAQLLQRGVVNAPTGGEGIGDLADTRTGSYRVDYQRHEVSRSCAFGAISSGAQGAKDLGHSRAIAALFYRAKLPDLLPLQCGIVR